MQNKIDKLYKIEKNEFTISELNKLQIYNIIQTITFLIYL